MSYHFNEIGDLAGLLLPAEVVDDSCHFIGGDQVAQDILVGDVQGMAKYIDTDVPGIFPVHDIRYPFPILKNGIEEIPLYELLENIIIDPFIPFFANTVFVDVENDVAGAHFPMYILSKGYQRPLGYLAGAVRFSHSLCMFIISIDCVRVVK